MGKVDKSRLVKRAFQTRAQNWLSGVKGSGTHVGMQYNSIWIDKDEDHVLTVMEERETAMQKFRATATENEQRAAESGAGEGAASGKHVLQNVMRKARQNIFPEGTKGWRTWKVQDILEIAFDAGEQ